MSRIDSTVPEEVICFSNQMKFAVYSENIVKCLICLYTNRVPIPLSEFYERTFT